MVGSSTDPERLLQKENAEEEESTSVSVLAAMEMIVVATDKITVCVVVAVGRDVG